MAEGICSCSLESGPDPDCPEHGMCASWGHPCHCGSARGRDGDGKVVLSPQEAQTAAEAVYAAYQETSAVLDGYPERPAAPLSSLPAWARNQWIADVTKGLEAIGFIIDKDPEATDG